MNVTIQHVNHTTTCKFEADIIDLEPTIFLAQLLAGDSATIEFDLSDVDAITSGSLASFVAIVRELLHHGKSVELIDCPQVILHNLYRAGQIDKHPKLIVTQPRQDEPTSS